ncbi:MAG TPA: septum formation initiator family protein [Propionibacterium sp.]|nr:septum formation initiator family protein [Propionibacterium sp.]
MSPIAAVRATAGRAASRIRRPAGKLALTRRALVLFAVVALLAVSFAGSLRVWVVQSQDLAAAQAQIEQRTARVAELEDELARWNDPAFVRAQARQRLGWVMPGEIGYRVVGADGEVLSGSTDIEGIGDPVTSDLAARWWDRAATSLRQADEPNPLAEAEEEGLLTEAEGDALAEEDSDPQSWGEPDPEPEG